MGIPLTVAAVGLAGVVVAGCAGGGGGSASGAAGAEAKPKGTGKRVLWVGDSIAGAEAPAMAAALRASGVAFKDASSTGGGTVVEGDRMSRQLAAGTWKRLDKDVSAFHPNVIAYQITTYDWGTQDQQRVGYEKLARVAKAADAELFLVTAPPFKIDDFYKKYESTFATAPKAAEQAAAHGGDRVRFLNAARLWGADAAAAKAQRSADGIHSCQQGSAAFARWFTKQLGAVYEFTPASPRTWADGSWTDAKRYAKLGCE